MATSAIHFQFASVRMSPPTTTASKLRLTKTTAALGTQLRPMQCLRVSELVKTTLSTRHCRSEVRAATADGDDGGAETKKVPLWRKELVSPENPTGENSPMRDDFLQDAAMEADIARLQKKRNLERRAANFERTGVASDDAPEAGGGTGLAKTAMEKVLVADFFFILFILAWLVAGLGEKAVLESTGLLDAWLPLWPALFQPALGLFMAGAIVSAVSGFLSNKPSK